MLILITVLPLAPFAYADEPASAPASQATSQPTPPPSSQPATTEDFLAGLYGKLLTSDDWLTRGVGLISLSRLPSESATEMILSAARDDRTSAVRVVAWQCLLARASSLSSEQFESWRKVTSDLAKHDAFRGQTRVGLLRFMSVCEPKPAAKKLWISIFNHTSAMEQQDIPVLDALADCLVAWRSPELMQFLFDNLSDTETQYRAEYVLHRAGCDAPWAGEHSDLGHNAMWKRAIETYADWWRKHRKQWREVDQIDEHAWKQLKPQYVPALDRERVIDRSDPYWRKEMELPELDVAMMDVAFVIDASGSMQWLIDYLKSDIARLMGACSLVSQKPRIGLTFFRDHGDMFVTRGTRLTSKLPALQATLGTIDAAGGEDEPEAIKEALVDALSNNPWRWDKNVRRTVVLITDAPPQPATQSDCRDIAEQCKSEGVTLYVIKATGNSAPELDEIAASAGTEAMPMTDLARWDDLYPPPDLNGNGWYIRIARASADDAIDRQILTALIRNCVNKQFHDRIEPLAGIMLALMTEHRPESRELFGVATRRTPGGPGSGPQAR